MAQFERTYYTYFILDDKIRIIHVRQNFRTLKYVAYFLSFIFNTQAYILYPFTVKRNDNRSFHFLLINKVYLINTSYYLPSKPQIVEIVSEILFISVGLLIARKIKKITLYHVYFDTPLDTKLISTYAVQRIFRYNKGI